MSKILITGGLGFIGTNLSKHLLSLGHEVQIVDTMDETLYNRSVKVGNLRELQTYPNMKWHLLDVCDLEALKKLQRVDTIYHLAAIAGVRPSLIDPLRYIRTNVEGTASVLELAKVFNSQVVFASSSSVYGTLPTPFAESNALTGMISPYAVTKRQGELLMEYYSREWGLKTTSLRFFTVYGPYGRPDMFIRRTIDKVVNGEIITLYGKGDTYRDYTYISDIVQGICLAGASSKDGYHVYNLGAGTPNTLLGTVKYIGEAVGRVPIVVHIETQKGDVSGTLADIQKAKRDLLYAPKVSLPLGIQHTVEWMRK